MDSSESFPPKKCSQCGGPVSEPLGYETLQHARVKPIPWINLKDWKREPTARKYNIGSICLDANCRFMRLYRLGDPPQLLEGRTLPPEEYSSAMESVKRLPSQPGQ
jgi:hypothetical protein